MNAGSVLVVSDAAAERLSLSQSQSICRPATGGAIADDDEDWDRAGGLSGSENENDNDNENDNEYGPSGGERRSSFAPLIRALPRPYTTVRRCSTCSRQ